MTTLRGMGAALAVGAAVLLGGCAVEDSTSLETNQIKLHFTGTLTQRARGLDLDATVFLAKGGSSLVDVDLAEGDRLVLIRGDTETAAERFLPGQYTWHLEAIPEPGSVQVELRRTEKTSASVHVTPQPALALQDSLEGRSFGADDTLELAWSNPLAGASLVVKPLASPCGGVQLGGQAPSIRVSDTGAFSVRAGDLLASAPPAEGTCVTLHLTRVGGESPQVAPGLYHEPGAAKDAHSTSYAQFVREMTIALKITP